MGRDIVDAHDVGAERRCQDVAGDRSEQAVHWLGLRIVQATEQGLARDPDEDGKAERPDLGQATQGFEVLLPALAEADARIEHDVAVGDAGMAGDGERPLEEAQHVGDDVDRRVDRLAVVHHHDRSAVCGRDDWAMSGSRCRPQTSLTMRGARLQRALSRWRPCRCPSRSGRPERRESRGSPAGCGPAPPRPLTGTWPGRVDSPPISTSAAPSATRRLGLGPGGLDTGEAAAIGEGIRRDVEDAHDQGASPEIGQQVGQGRAGRGHGVSSGSS